jgi:hypothetical protein
LLRIHGTLIRTAATNPLTAPATAACIKIDECGSRFVANIPLPTQRQPNSTALSIRRVDMIILRSLAVTA